MSQKYVMYTKYNRVAKGMAMFNDVNCYVTKTVNMLQQNKQSKHKHHCQSRQLNQGPLALLFDALPLDHRAK